MHNTPFIKTLVKFNPDQYSRPKIILAVVILFILTFPYITLDVGTGLDAAYFWFFNYYFVHDFSKLLDVFHSFGPFSFLISPRYHGYNYEVWLLWLVILKCGSIYFFLKLAEQQKKPFFPVILMLSVVFLLINPRFLYYTLSLPLLLLYKNTNRITYLLPVLFMCVFTLYLKITIFLFTNALCWSFLLLGLTDKKQQRDFFILLGIYAFLHTIFLFGLYGTFNRIVEQLNAWLGFSLGNSSMYTITPENSIILLIITATSFFAPFYIERKQNTAWYFIGMLPLMFLVYKYAFARQDSLHAKAMIYMVIIIASGFLLSFKKIHIASILFFIFSLVFFHLNLSASDFYYSFKLRNGPNFFWQALKSYPVQKQMDMAKSRQQFLENKISDSLRAEIGNHTVDILPWDLTFVEINNLNYKPRPMLQTGTLYANPAMDKNNAEYLRKAGPDYFIWEHQKWNGMLGGIDNQYLLNADPEFWNELFGRYQVQRQDSVAIALERKSLNRLTQINDTSSLRADWFEWITLPEIKTNHILKVNLSTKRSIIGKFIAALYKEKEYLIDYYTQDGLIFTHRLGLVGGNAELWLSPYLTEVSNSFQGHSIDKIRIRYTEPDLYFCPDIKLTFKKLEIVPGNFQQNQKNDRYYNHYQKTIAYATFNSIDSGWNISHKQILQQNGNKVFQVLNPFEATYKFSTDSILNTGDSTFFYGSVAVYTQKRKLKPIYLVLQVVDQEGQTIHWANKKLDMHREEWFLNGFIFEKNFIVHPGETIVFFIWNPNKETILIDDLNLSWYQKVPSGSN